MASVVSGVVIKRTRAAARLRVMQTMRTTVG